MNSTLLVLWHGALFPSYRKPFWLLQTQYGWNVHLFAAKAWRKALPGKTRFQPSPEEPIALHVYRAFFAFHGACHIQPAWPFVFSRIRPDVVFVVEEPFSLMGWLAVYWSKRSVPQVPVVLYTYQDIYKNYPFPFRTMERYVMRHADRILVSHSAGGQVLERKGYEKLWDVLPTAVNLERFLYKEPLTGGPLFTLGYVGRLTEEKGLDTLFWALSELEDHVRLRLVGDGPARYRLAVLARELGISERIAFLGAVSHEELVSLYHEFDALVLPSKTTSRWREQFGRVLVEAMACGVPVIGSDSGAIPEVLGDAGLIFPEGRAAGLADRILMLVQDARLRRYLSFRGRIRVEQNFSAERVAKKMNQHLTEVMERAGRP